MVSGGTGGLGRAVTLAFPAEGAHVAIPYIDDHEFNELKAAAAWKACTNHPAHVTARAPGTLVGLGVQAHALSAHKSPAKAGLFICTHGPLLAGTVDAAFMAKELYYPKLGVPELESNRVLAKTIAFNFTTDGLLNLFLASF